MLSNVISHKGRTNEILLDWIDRNKYNLIKFDGRIRKTREEVIVVNY
jgi:hypothetical protein